MKNSAKSWFSALTIFTVFGCTGNKTAEGTWGKVQTKDLIQRVTVAGTIVPYRKTMVQVSYDGFIRKLYVTIGQHVKKDDPLASVSQSLQSTETVFPLRAPYDGTIVQILKREGESLTVAADSSGNPNNRILRLDDLSKLMIDVAIPEIDFAKMKVGLEAKIRASSILDQTYKGIIRELSLAAKEQDRNNRGQAEYTGKIEILNPDEHLHPGMSVMLDLIVDQRQKVLTLAHEYLQKDGEDYFVTTRTSAHQKIKVGLRNEEDFEITEGLKLGEEVQQVDYMNLLKKAP